MKIKKQIHLIETSKRRMTKEDIEAAFAALV